jgi:hypothetical protein
MKAERTLSEEPTPSPMDLADELPSARVRRLRSVNASPAWDPYEVWRTRVKRQSREWSAEPAK